MTIALLIAGGVGARMGQDIPKQFLHIQDKPVIVYTMERFQNNPLIDGIVVVTLPSWITFVEAYAKQFGITKLKSVVAGGETGHDSIHNGVFEIARLFPQDTAVMIHDGIRPLVDDTVLTDVIQKAIQYGNGVTSLPYNEQIFIVNPDDETTTKQYIPRETLRRVSTPQAYQFQKLDTAYHEAFEKGIGIHGSSYTNTMMVELGETLHFAAGSDKNIKLTTKDDLEMFKGYMNMDKDTWLK